ncbi:MAG: monovalent cation/H+ antiporter complex subunit F [Caldilinea sp.]|nr:monovalent cation/H+ antiporter complex subunit F [Caldilinea sp.]MDW8442267.1 monovalent cation/H+ antiporter complex subunit F [Caldilineaceae bacterium]
MSMDSVYHAAALFLLLTIGVGLIRIWRGPTTADRLLAIQLFGTTGTAILILLSVAVDDVAFQNVALIFALLAGVLGVVFTQYAAQADRPQNGAATGEEKQHELE